MIEKMQMLTGAFIGALVGVGLLAGAYFIGAASASASQTAETRTYSGTGNAKILDTDKFEKGRYTLTFTADNHAKLEVRLAKRMGRRLWNLWSSSHLPQRRE